MKIGLAQINTTVGDFAGNLESIRRCLDEFRQAKVELVVFPEQAIPGYPAEDLLEREDFIVATEETFAQAVDACRGIAMVLGTVTRAEGGEGNQVYNSAVLVDDGRVVGTQHKTLLPTYDVFDESRYFRAASEHAVFEFHGQKLGLAICEDYWNDPGFWESPRYPVDPIEVLVEKGAEVLIGIAASPYSLGRERFRYRLLKNTAIRYRLPIVYTNLVGGNTTLVFDGGSFALNAKGELLAEAPVFREALTLLDLSGTPVVKSPPGTGLDENDRTNEVTAEFAYQALVLGTRDYMQKSGFKKAVIGLSGGIDSALTATIACDAIGAENVIGVSMPSRYSSAGSRTDAEWLATNLKIDYHSVPIENVFEATLATLGRLFKDLPADVTEENLQARARGMILMAISNKFGALLLTTGNKSELAVGYCTLYGDMSGGLAIISDVPKTLVYRLARWVNRDGEVIPTNTIEKPPSAELRPDQKDEDSLPPYDVLDAILEAYIEDGLGVQEMESQGLDAQLVAEVVRLVDLNEYKRKQAAPGIRITGKAFGPGRRFPIVQRFRRS